VGRNNFFPSTYRVDAVPVPLEQLDMAMTASASMSPFDTFAPDRVQVLVPVPQIWFEPDLLKVEAVSPQFQKEIDTLDVKISESLLRRKDVRRKHGTLVRSITAEDPTYVEGDPPADAPNKEPAFGTQEKLDANKQPVIGKDGKPVLLVTIIDGLKQKLEATRGQILGAPELDQFDPLGLEGFATFLRDRVDRASDRIDFGFLRVQTDIYRMRQLILNNVAATRLATSPVLASIAQGDSAVATKADIQAFLDASKATSAPKSKTEAVPPAAATGTTISPATISGNISSGLFATKAGSILVKSAPVADSAMAAKTILQSQTTGKSFAAVATTRLLARAAKTVPSARNISQSAATWFQPASRTSASASDNSAAVSAVPMIGSEGAITCIEMGVLAKARHAAGDPVGGPVDHACQRHARLSEQPDRF
jgi:hypothetical protein